jgi:hypothetical protein
MSLSPVSELAAPAAGLMSIYRWIGEQPDRYGTNELHVGVSVGVRERYPPILT